eukprot:Skav232910  [mRNA]  locus=scaffold1477:544096:545106:- [translate_table: standard]
MLLFPSHFSFDSLPAVAIMESLFWNHILPFAESNDDHHDLHHVMQLRSLNKRAEREVSSVWKEAVRKSIKDELEHNFHHNFVQNPSKFTASRLLKKIKVLRNNLFVPAAGDSMSHLRRLASDTTGDNSLDMMYSQVVDILIWHSVNLAESPETTEQGSNREEVLDQSGNTPESHTNDPAGGQWQIVNPAEPSETEQGSSREEMHNQSGNTPDPERHTNNALEDLNYAQVSIKHKGGSRTRDLFKIRKLLAAAARVCACGFIATFMDIGMHAILGVDQKIQLGEVASLRKVVNALGWIAAIQLAGKVILSECIASELGFKYSWTLLLFNGVAHGIAR